MSQPKPVNPAGEQVRSKATTALIMGIIGFFCVGIVLGPIAIYMANQAKRLMQDLQAGQEHEGLITAALIIGWIVTILNIIGLILGIVYIIVIMLAIGAGAAGGF